MLTKVLVEDFRHLRSITLDGLGRVAFIAGKNGTGKTALLEALWLLTGPDLPELTMRIDVLRGLPILGEDTDFNDIFRRFDTRNVVKISAHGDWGKNPRTLEIRLQERTGVTTIRSDSFNRHGVDRLSRSRHMGELELVFTYRHDNGRKYISKAWWIAEHLTSAKAATASTADLQQERQIVKKRPTSVFMAALHRENPQDTASKLGRLQLVGDDDQLLRLVRPLEPRIQRLTTITVDDTPVIYAYLAGLTRPIPVQLLGEGLNRMVTMALSVSQATGGLLLVDEIENGLHHSVQEEVFSVLLDLVRSFDVQLFATTHSSECIRAADRAFQERGEDDFGLYHLELIDGEVQVDHFDREMVATSIEYDMEVR